MTVKKERKKVSKSSVKPVVAAGPAIADIANTKVSRRTLLKGTATAAAVVGVSSVAMKGMRLQPVREQSSTTSSSSTYTLTNTATLPPPAPVTATSSNALRTIVLSVNGTNYNVNVQPRSMLVDVLREDLNLIATKRACNRMECGACTVLIDGVPHEACQFMAIRAVGHAITTSEFNPANDPVINALQQAWVTEFGAQCGFCSPGMIMVATALLKANPSPSVADIKEALSGNLCRCGNYMHQIAAIQLAATNLGGA